MTGRISVRGARVHNLRNVDVDLPRDQLVVITGPSGSGKSSLAFDTIYAEGQRRYVESLSVHARQSLELMARPDCDSIEGLSPAIAIEQHSAVRNPRSTVGTITEIYDFLRLLYARVGAVHCYRCGREIAAHTVQQIADRVLAMAAGTRFIVIAPVVRGQAGALDERLAELGKAGYVRVAVDGVLHDLSAGLPAIAETGQPHDVHVHVDRLVVKEGMSRRLADSIELALSLADGQVWIQPVDGEVMRFSQRFACMDCGVSYPELEPRLFSFNSPHGACPACEGLGARLLFDPARLVPDAAKSLREGAIAPLGKRASSLKLLEAACAARGFDMDTPWKKLPAAARALILHGDAGAGSAAPAGDAAGDAPDAHLSAGTSAGTSADTSDGTSAGASDDAAPARGKKRSKRKAAPAPPPFEGVIALLDRRLADADRKRSEADADADADADSIHDELRPYMREATCASCEGARLRVEARHVTVGGAALPALCAWPLDQTLSFFRDLTLGRQQAAIAQRLLQEITGRLAFLVSVGLSYLALDRRAATLSGGEGQRIRLATQIGASLVGVLYILDEPSIGLHPRDTRRLLDALVRLRDLGNTVLVVEHDADTMRAADYLVDMGPGAGIHGGQVVAAGVPAAVLADPASLTGQYLSGARSIEVPQRRRRGQGAITLQGVRTHNLQDVTVDLPLGVLVCVTGVSGSGKSSLIIDTLLPALRARLVAGAAGAARGALDDGVFEAIRGIDPGHRQIDRVLCVDQAPIGRTPRSNPATYTGVFALIRERFAALPESKARGYKAGRYSFNVKGGRCEACQGEGVLRIEMNFLPDVYVECETCRGQRFSRETLDIRYKGCNIAEVLAMSVDEALPFWLAVPQIRGRLEALRDVGLGYLTLGQAANTLSGGEAQRLKLSRELARKQAGHTLYILDEPTTGLHFEDVRRLLHVLELLVEQGNTVLVIEHDLDVIKTADHVIDMGPEGGRDGGRVVATGTPEDIARTQGSYTGAFLRGLLRG
jgi:excinuclease ABC subunit A